MVGALLKSVGTILFGDPFLQDGARMVVRTSDSPRPDPAWAGVSAGTAQISGAVKRTETSAATPDCQLCVTWKGQKAGYLLNQSKTNGDGSIAVFPPGGIALQRFLYVYISIEEYQRTRNGIVEGSAMSDGNFILQVDDNGALPGSMPPSGQLPEGGLPGVAIIGDIGFLDAKPSNLPYEIDFPPPGGDVRFGLGSAVGLDLFATKTVCQPYTQDFHSWLLGLRNIPAAHRDFILVQNLSTQYSPKCIVAGLIASIVHIYGNASNSRALIRAYVKSLIKLDNRVNELWLVNNDTGTPGPTKVIQATVTVTPWFIPLSVLGDKHPDTFILENALHKNPDFWAGRGATVGGLLKLGEPVVIPKDIPLDDTKGIRMPVSVPTWLDGVYGILFLAPDLTDVQWVSGTSVTIGITGSLNANSDPSLYLIDGGKDVAVGMPTPVLTQGYLFRGLPVQVYNGKPSSVTQV